MSVNRTRVGEVDCGAPELFLIAGPCVIEDEPLMMRTAEALQGIAGRLGVPLIFKSSFMKDNRSSVEFYSGPGLDEGLAVLGKVKSELGLALLTDVHYPEQVGPVAEVVDVVQIPAFLAMQTSLVTAAARTGRAVNLKHAQFLAPENMSMPVRKIEAAGSREILVTERGYTFGYNDLVVDPRSFHLLGELGYPVIFDLTHSIRRYGIPSRDPAGGARQFLPVLARAAVAAGVDGLFMEVHPEPASALCDAASQFPLDELEEFLKPLLELHAVVSRTRR
ncbi:MAG: 3-deoxy-8-phosphooctulonate synthase [Actinomycetota bacterium]